MKGLISRIQRASMSDGPGVRTTVFLMGCPLDCTWCHNPETRPGSAMIMQYSNVCTHCGACVSVCTGGARRLDGGMLVYNRDICKACGACALACPSRAAEHAGMLMDTGAVIDTVMRDKAFYDATGGGMTISGGEPLYQYEFTKELLTQAKARELLTCLDTTGFGGCAAGLVPLTDLYLWDIKHTDAAAHERWTGVPLAPLLDALHETDTAGGVTRLRCPIIPGVNDTAGHMRGVAGIANSLRHAQGIDLIAYHPLGVHKAAAMGASQDDMGVLESEARAALLDTLARETALPVRWHQ